MDSTRGGQDWGFWGSHQTLQGPRALCQDGLEWGSGPSPEGPTATSGLASYPRPCTGRSLVGRKPPRVIWSRGSPPELCLSSPGGWLNIPPRAAGSELQYLHPGICKLPGALPSQPSSSVISRHRSTRSDAWARAQGFLPIAEEYGVLCSPQAWVI